MISFSLKSWEGFELTLKYVQTINKRPRFLFLYFLFQAVHSANLTAYLLLRLTYFFKNTALFHRLIWVFNLWLWNDTVTPTMTLNAFSIMTFFIHLAGSLLVLRIILIWLTDWSRLLGIYAGCVNGGGGPLMYNRRWTAIGLRIVSDLHGLFMTWPSERYITAFSYCTS